MKFLTLRDRRRMMSIGIKQPRILRRRPVGTTLVERAVRSRREGIVMAIAPTLQKYLSRKYQVY
jgi:hypothetical protein